MVGSRVKGTETIRRDKISSVSTHRVKMETHFELDGSGVEVRFKIRDKDDADRLRRALA